MKSFPRILVAALAMAGAMAVHAAADTPIVPARVNTVATGGEWSSAKDSGTLRIVVVNQGFEHVQSKLWLEWLAIGENEERRLAARVLVEELSNGFSVVRLDTRRKTFDGTRIRLLAANPYSAEDSEVTITAGKPGRYKIISRPVR